MTDKKEGTEKTPSSDPGKKGSGPQAPTEQEIERLLSSRPPEGRRPILLIGLISALLVVVVVLAYLLYQEQYGVEAVASSKVGQMNEVVTRIRNLETDMNERQKEIFALMEKYRKDTGKTLPVSNLMNLTGAEKQLMEERIRQEQDVSTKSLLSEIVSRNNEISELKKQVKDLEAILPAPHEVQKGENHYQIALNYLTAEKQLAKEDALSAVEKVNLFEPLLPGFKVWNFYSNGVYGTFVTQGEAQVSPNTMARRAKKQLVDARDEARSQRDKLQTDIEVLASKRQELIQQLELLGQEKENVIQRLGEMNQINAQLQQNISSLHYALDTRKNLKERGILKGGFLRSTKLTAVSPEVFNNSVDLRSVQVISITAQALNIPEINDVTLYPGFFKEGVDYRIEISENGASASLILMTPEKFQGERVVLAIN